MCVRCLRTAPIAPPTPLSAVRTPFEIRQRREFSGRNLSPNPALFFLALGRYLPVMHVAAQEATRLLDCMQRLAASLSLTGTMCSNCNNGSS